MALNKLVFALLIAQGASLSGKHDWKHDWKLKHAGKHATHSKQLLFEARHILGSLNHADKPDQKHPVQQKAIAVKEAQPTGRPSKNESAAEATGVAQNEAGDLNAFIAALVTNVITILIFFLVGGWLRRRYPLVYSKECLTLKDQDEVKEQMNEDTPADVKEIMNQSWEDKVPFVPDDSFWGWSRASADVTIEQFIEFRGLDQAMLIEFTHVAMKMLGTVGLPLVFIMGPCHCWLGGYRAGAPGTEEADYLSYWGMANVVDYHPWLYWAHAVMLWITVVAIQRIAYTAMREFMVHRNHWLKSLPAPRATTILVEGIPEECRSDEKLKAYFDKIFGSSVVQMALLIKDTDGLLRLTQAENDAQSLVEEINFKLLKEKTAEDQQKLKDAEAALKEAKQSSAVERKSVLKAAKEEEPGVNLSKGFVTFKNRRDAELAKMMVFRANAEEFVVSIPPDPADIIYTDLQKDPVAEQIRMIIGYGLIACVFYAYLPTVIGLAYYTSLETLAEYGEPFAGMAEDPATSALWDGLVNALALQLFVSFVPTFFVMIFSNFFVLKAAAYLQHKIQDWYFYFLVIFILLVTAVGSSLLDTMQALAENPLGILKLLADTLPLSTHFYLNYIPLQWVTHAQNLLRTANLGKFKMFGKVFGVPIAIKKMEPEDQDYYGLGSRSARFAFLLVLALNFGSLSPLVTILGFFNFWMCRKVYGYLCCFCEIKKPDLGGVFYVNQLMHVQQGSFIYIILMTGVLLERDATYYPCMISGSALIFQHISYARFKSNFRWESLSFEELEDLTHAPSMTSKFCKSPAVQKSSSAKYEQPELIG